MHSCQCRPTAHLEFHYREIWSRVLQQFFLFLPLLCWLCKSHPGQGSIGPSRTELDWTLGRKKKRERTCMSILSCMATAWVTMQKNILHLRVHE